MKTFVIAEAGSNHNGSLDIAKKMIDVAAEAGCDAVKFQLFKSETMYSSKTKDFAQYQDLPALIKKLEFDRSWTGILKQYCDEQNIEFMATPFDEDAIKVLVGVGVKRMKIAGFEASDPRFVRAVTSTGLPTIISLGSGLNAYDAETVLDMIHSAFQDKVTFLHCNNAYPTPDADANLVEIQRLLGVKKVGSHKFSVGLSDHTTGILAPSLAVAMGATVIEKHFTLNNNMQGPDHAFAIEPHELREMVKLIRATEVLVGDGKNGYTVSESEYRFARRSVIASRDVKAGERLNEMNITTKRPYEDGAIPAKKYYEVLTSRVVFLRDMKKDDVIHTEDVQWHQ